MYDTYALANGTAKAVLADHPQVAERVEESAERGGSDALLSAPLTVGSESDEAREVVLELRDEVRAVSPEALVGGATATSVDTDAASQRDYVVVIPAILLVVTQLSLSRSSRDAAPTPRSSAARRCRIVCSWLIATRHARNVLSTSAASAWPWRTSTMP